MSVNELRRKFEEKANNDRTHNQQKKIEEEKGKEIRVLKLIPSFLPLYLIYRTSAPNHTGDVITHNSLRAELIRALLKHKGIAFNETKEDPKEEGSTSFNFFLLSSETAPEESISDTLKDHQITQEFFDVFSDNIDYYLDKGFSGEERNDFVVNYSKLQNFDEAIEKYSSNIEQKVQDLQEEAQEKATSNEKKKQNKIKDQKVRKERFYMFLLLGIGVPFVVFLLHWLAK